MKTILILLTALLFNGCLYFNDSGVSNRYYPNCKEYYDAMGIYHKTCDENLVDYKTVNNGVKDGINSVKTSISGETKRPDKIHKNVDISNVEVDQ